MTAAPLAVSTLVEAALQLGPLAAIGLLYTQRARTLGAAGHPPPPWRRACFYSGLAVVLVALLGLGGLSQEELYVHMVEHLLLGDIAALLLVLGLTGPLLAPVLRIRLFDRLRVLAHPLVAFPLWAIDLYVWHLPVLYEAALRHAEVHALQHVMFLAFGVNMWMSLLGPLPMPAWFGNLGRLLYVVAVRLTGAVLGNIFLWSGTVFYPFYHHGDALHGIAPLADQNIAGAVMMVQESLLTIGLLCWLFLRTAREAEQRQELLDYARSNGLDLSERRAARAVAGGHAAELRRRLQAAARSRGTDEDQAGVAASPPLAGGR
jgi:cytochrome c oxidase assembly factor CtaG